MVAGTPSFSTHLFCEDLCHRAFRCDVSAVFAEQEAVFEFGCTEQNDFVAESRIIAGGEEESAQEAELFFRICDHGSPAFARGQYERGPSDPPGVDFRTVVCSEGGGRERVRPLPVPGERAVAEFFERYCVCGASSRKIRRLQRWSFQILFRPQLKLCLSLNKLCI